MINTNLLLLLLLTLLPLLSSFNLETRAPVVKLGGDYINSFFGFSVAQHKTGDGEPVILIGAPQDRNLQPGTERSGALYRCPLSSDTGDCLQVVTDGKRHNSGPYNGIYDGGISQLKRPVRSEIKDGQWLGVAVSSQGPGGKVIVCAHRYTVRDDFDSKRAMLGLCYILESDLSLPPNKNIGANNILVVREALRGKKLKVVADFDNHLKYGVCQVGTAVSWTKPTNTSQDRDYALFGAPGCFNWRGNLLGQRTGSISKYQQALGEEDNANYTKHGHLGLAVTSGVFFDGELQFVTGAPHVNRGEAGTGEIYFYTLNRKSDKLEMNDQWTLSGGSFGAGYGFSLATVDANGDGEDDLLVSAPFTDSDGRGGSVFLYLNQDSGLRRESFVEIRGAGPEGQFGLAVSSVGDINKDGYDDFAVGSPYEGAGVVYLFLGGVHGVSRLKYGTPWLKAEQVSSQTIRASDFLAPGHIPVPADFASFGASLSGGMDLDDNDYPDLVIGAYSSNAVVMLKSRPIISVSTHLAEDGLHNIDPGKAGCDLDPESDHACFSFEACFKVESKEDLSLRIKFTIVAEPKKAVSRVWLKLAEVDEVGVSSRSSSVDHMLFIQDVKQQHCTSIVGYVSDSQTDLQSPVQFALSYSLVQDEPTVSYNLGQPLPSVDRYPILDQQQAKRTFSANFQKNCGSDDVCQAQLLVSPKLADKEKELGKGLQGVYQLELGTLKDNELILDVDVENLGEAAYEASLDISFSSSQLSYIGLGVGSEVNAPNLVNSSYLTVDLGNPFKGASSKGANKAKIRLRFSPASVINQKLISFYFFANTTSQLVVDSSTVLNCVVVKRAELQIMGRGEPTKVLYGSPGSEIKGESAMGDVAEIGPLVDHRYLVKNSGPSMVDVLTVRISWPFQVENNKPQGKWLLYLTSHPLVKNGAGSCRLPPGHFPNPLNLSSHSEPSKVLRQPKSGPENLWTPSSETVDRANGGGGEGAAGPAEYLSRSRREVEQIVSPHLETSQQDHGKDQLVLRLDCDRGTAKCLTITCQVYNLKANNSFTIEIRSRLWNATLVEDYSNIDRVEILSKASVIIDPVYTQDVSNDYKSIVSLALPDHQLEPLQGPSWWIYVVAAGCGVLLLVIIITLLSKLGFFKRKRPEDDDFLMSANFEKARLTVDGDM